MSRTRRRAKLGPDLLGKRSTPAASGSDIVSSGEHEGSEGSVAVTPASAPKPEAATSGQRALFEKGTATALAFQPSHWSYEAIPESEGSRLSPGSVLTTKAETERAPTSTLPAEQTTNAAMPTPVGGAARTVEDRAAMQTVAASLAEIIDGILRTRQFAVRGIHESFRKRPVTSTPPVEQLATAEDIESALRAELAHARVDPDAKARLARSLINVLLGFMGRGERAAEVASDPVRDRTNIR